MGSLDCVLRVTGVHSCTLILIKCIFSAVFHLAYAKIFQVVFPPGFLSKYVFIFKLSHSCLSVSSISFLNFTNNTNREAPYCLFSPFSCFLLSLMSISSPLISDMITIQVVCDMTPCRLVNIYRRVGGACYLHPQGAQAFMTSLKFRTIT